MSFGLKNASATYQRAIQTCLDQQIVRNIEAYIDDMVVKTRIADKLITDLEETFSNLSKYRWKLNPSKCIFGVPSGILLGYIVSAQGIEPNPDKVSAITNMKRPTCVKDIQKLIGLLSATLYRASAKRDYRSLNSSRPLSTSPGRRRQIQLSSSSSYF